MVDAAVAAPPLRRQREFVRLWAGQTISVFGDQISMLALPLVAVLTLDASALEMGILTAAGWAPHLVFSLFAGAWVDRRGRRQSLLVAMDLGRAAALTTIPLAYTFGVLAMGQLYAVAFLVGSLTVVFDVTYAAFFMLIVPRSQVVDANSRLSVSRSASFIGGPALAGFLVQALRAPFALLADALSFVGSALFIARIRADEPPSHRSDGASIWADLNEGLRFLFGHAVLRAGLACTSTINFFNFAFLALVVLYMSRELELSAGVIGVVFGIGALGGLAGALVAGRVGRRLGIGPAILLGSVLFPAPLLLFPLADGPQPVVVAVLIAGEFLASVGVMIFDVNQNSLGVLLTPHRLRSRVVGSGRTFNYGVRPLGALLGGVLGEAIGLRPALWVGAAGACLGVLWLLFSPIPRLRELPEEASVYESRYASGLAEETSARHEHCSRELCEGSPMSRGSVLRRRGVAPLLAAEVVSTTGAQMTWVALPWFVLTTTGSATQMTLVMAAELIGVGVFGLPGGKLLARLGARRSMLLADAARAPLMLLVPILYWADALAFGWLVALAFALGALTAPYFAAQRIIVPELLGEDEQAVSEASALFQAAQRVTMLVGPVLGGILIGVLDAPIVLLIDGATYVVSMLLVLWFVPRTAPAGGEKAGGIREGLRFIVRDRLIRVWWPVFAVGDAAWAAFFATVPVLVVASFGSNPAVAGWLIASFGAGAVFGNAISYRFLLRRFEGLTLVAVCIMGQALPLWLLPLPVPAAVLSAALVLSGIANGLVNPSIHTIFTLRVPAHLRPTVMTTLMLGWAVSQPIGLFVVGPVLDAVGAQPVLVAFAAVQTATMALAALAALRARARAEVVPAFEAAR